jgi:hypothetical protein
MYNVFRVEGQGISEEEGGNNAMIGVSKLEFYENHLICGKQGEMGTRLSKSTNKLFKIQFHTIGGVLNFSGIFVNSDCTRSE